MHQAQVMSADNKNIFKSPLFFQFYVEMIYQETEISSEVIRCI